VLGPNGAELDPAMKCEDVDFEFTVEVKEKAGTTKEW
jgi:hypothetical protein